MSFRAKPAGVVEKALGEGGLNLAHDAARSVGVVAAPFKFTVTSPYMLARTLLDRYYNDFEILTIELARIMAMQVENLPVACVQIDEANIPGNPKDWILASKSINIILDKISVEKSVHLCFGNYGGQIIQEGTWKTLIDFINSLYVDHVILELAHRPEEDLDALVDIRKEIALGIGVVDIKVNHVETPDEIAFSIDKAAKKLGPDRIRWIHPDCGFWMLKRSIADRKMEALVRGRDKYLSV